MPIKTPDNHVDQCIVMLQDLTDLEVLKRSQEELLQAKETAESANRAKGEFLANMSHEVRTPLTCILSVSSHLEEMPLSNEQQECVGMIQRSGKSLLTIINDILDFSRIEAGRLAIDPVPFDLAAMVDDMAGLVAERAEEKGIELIVRYGRDIPSRVVGDVGRIRQALMNLVANAIKFTHTGHVLIDVAKLDADDANATLRFTVEDTGIGIPADKLSSVFDKFTQADGSITRCYGGTGLGLAISKQLVELMNGTISVSSTVDSGSTFTFTLTLPLVLGAPAALAGDDLSDLRVLVLHGHEKVRSVAAEQIAGWNSRAHGVATGSEAIVALRAAHDEGAPFHLVIVSRDIPDMRPEALATVLCTDPALRSTTLVLATTLRQRRDIAWLRAAGFDAYLTCPLRPSQIANALATARSKRS
jgi:nitrogen-specific signal transduction histidine kinase/CheY-like chemotaxis protein